MDDAVNPVGNPEINAHPKQWLVTLVLSTIEAPTSINQRERPTAVRAPHRAAPCVLALYHETDLCEPSTTRWPSACDRHIFYAYFSPSQGARRLQQNLAAKASSNTRATLRTDQRIALTNRRLVTTHLNRLTSQRTLCREISDTMA